MLSALRSPGFETSSISSASINPLISDFLMYSLCAVPSLFKLIGGQLHPQVVL